MTAVAGTQLATTTWQIDETHTSAQFSVRHLMISTVRGRFAQTKGTVSFDPANPTSVEVRVEIPLDSITTHDDKRDAHLKSADFFDAANYPTLTFVSKRLEGDITSQFKLFGNLTIRGTTKPFVLNVTNEGAGGDPWGNERMGFNATGKLNRTDFGLHWNAALEAGGVLVGEEVKLNVDVEIVRPKS